MSFTAFVIGFGIISYLCFYLSNNVRLDRVPKGRVLEKALYFMLGIIVLFGLSVLMVVQTQNDATVGFLEPITTAVLVIVSLFSLLLLYSYMYYLLRKHISSISKVKEKDDEDELK